MEQIRISIRDLPFQRRGLRKDVIRTLYEEFKLSLNEGCVLIATDGSKTHCRTTVAGKDFTNRKSFSGDVDTYCSINTAECIALILALRKFVTANKNYIILTDSMSVLEGLKLSRNPSSGVIKLKNELLEARTRCETIKLVWVPGHTGIAENEKVDKMAKKAKKRTISYYIPEEDIVREEKNLHAELQERTTA
ncbi:hypothetical protein JTE90_026973 [Oedothorax gibbosus]|uniref:RNase H type-1 domain-containing protein n=1 Tax=Oedothorax gibbosus TaxID=931172 RepID=A0AAV6U3V2_9ARAC|nr:hypothetical protein JTE90_026973 [Oedothorax gibbosus]